MKKIFLKFSFPKKNAAIHTKFTVKEHSKTHRSFVALIQFAQLAGQSVTQISPFSSNDCRAVVCCAITCRSAML